MEIKEIWKITKDHSNDYAVSNLGNVKSLIHNRLLKSSPSKDGYRIAYLNKKPINVSKLVAIYFVKNPYGCNYVRHIDGNKINDAANNLEWCTRKNSRIITKKKERNDPKISYQVFGINNNGSQISFPSLKEAERNGFFKRGIVECCRGIRKQYKGYRWYSPKINHLHNNQEMWAVIDGFDGRYSISTWGNVRSNITNKKLSQSKQNRYYVVNLCKNKKWKTYRVNRLVAQTFIPNPNNYPFVNHIDEKRTNNNVENLEWCTAKYNSNYGTGQMRKGKSRSSSKKVCKAVIATHVITHKIEKYDSMKSVAEAGFAKGIVRNCCLGLRKSYRDRIWTYGD